MNKKLIIVVVLILILIAVPVMAKPKKTPPGQKKAAAAQPTTTTAPTSTSTPTTTKKTSTTTPTTTKPSTTTTSTAEKETNWDMIGAILAGIAILAAIIGWIFSRKQKGKTSKYLKKINETYAQYKSNSTKCEAKLSALKAMIEKEFTDGKIDQNGMDFLDKRIDKYVRSLRVGMVDSFDVSTSAKKEVEEMLEDGIITEKEYNRFLQRKKMDEADFERLHKQMDKWRKKSIKKIPIKMGGKKK